MKYLDVPQSGSQASTTASRNRFGQYKRNRSMPTQPRTAAQIAVRSSLASFSQSWKTLTQDQMTAWSAWGDAHPRVNSLGAVIKMTGAMAYTSVNQMLAIAARPPVTDPPSYTDVETPVTAVDFTGPGMLPMTIGSTDPLAYTVIACSPPRSPGVSFNNDFRFIGVSLNDDTDPTIVDLAPLITAKFGAYAENVKFFIQIYNINGFGVTNAYRRFVGVSAVS